MYVCNAAVNKPPSPSSSKGLVLLGCRGRPCHQALHVQYVICNNISYCWHTVHHFYGPSSCQHSAATLRTLAAAYASCKAAQLQGLSWLCAGCDVVEAAIATGSRHNKGVQVVVLAASIPCRPNRLPPDRPRSMACIDRELAELGHIMRSLALANTDESIPA